MAENEDEFLAYICFEKGEPPLKYKYVMVQSHLAEIESWKAVRRGEVQKQNSSPPEDPEEEVQKPDKIEVNGDDRIEKLSDIMKRFKEDLSTYNPLVKVLSVIMPIYRSGFIEHEMYPHAKKTCALLDDDGRFETYGVSFEKSTLLLAQITRVKELYKGEVALPAAILLSLVATYDTLFSDVLKVMMRIRPERYSASVKTFTVKEILSMGSFNDFVSQVIDDEVNNIMRGSHSDQIKFVEDSFNIKIRDTYARWGEYIEIFERRNLTAHGSSKVNNIYLESCGRAGLKVSDLKKGQKLELNQPYLLKSIDLLIEFGVTLIFVFLRKNFPDKSESIYDALHELTYELIKEEKVNLAAELLEFALYKQKPAAKDRILKIMTVNLANAQKKAKNQDRTKEIISSVDWSAAANEFKICIASLEENVEEVVRLMPVVSKEEVVSADAFRTWPVFDWVRDKEEIRRKFLEVFGEELIQISKSEITDDNLDNPGTSETLH